MLILIHTLWLLYFIYFDCLFDGGVLDFGAFLLAYLLCCTVLFFGIGKSGGVGRCGRLCGRKEGRKGGRKVWFGGGGLEGGEVVDGCVERWKGR